MKRLMGKIPQFLDIQYNYPLKMVNFPTSPGHRLIYLNKRHGFPLEYLNIACASYHGLLRV